MFLSDEVGTEEHESVGWTWNITLSGACPEGSVCETGELEPRREGKESELGTKDLSLSSHSPVQ